MYRMKPKPCDELRSEWERSEPGSPLPEPLARHLSACARCRREWSAWSHIHQKLVMDAGTIVPPPKPRARAELVMRIRERSHSSPPSSLFRRTLPLAAGLAACVGMLWLPIFHSRLPTARVSTGISPRAHRHLPVPGARIARAFGPDAPSIPNGGADLASPTPSLPRDRSSGRIPGFPLLHSRIDPSRKRRSFANPANPPRSKDNSSGTPIDSPRDDMEIVNALPADPKEPGLDRAVDRILDRGDDFISVPLPRIAAADSPATGGIVSDAIRQYQTETKIVDPRLFQKVDLSIQGGDLQDFIDLLNRESGVKFYVRKDLADLNLTILAEKQPIRDLMRQVVRLFNLQWSRHGEEGHYRYELGQSLKERLKEEELRRQDEDQMLLNVVDGLQPYLGEKDKPKAEIEAQAKVASDQLAAAGSVEERKALQDRLQMLNALQQDHMRDLLGLFSQLTPDQLVALKNGQEIDFNYQAGDPSSVLTPEMAQHVLNDMGNSTINGKTARELPLDQSKVKSGLRLSLDRPDQVELYNYTGVSYAQAMIMSGNLVITGQPDRLRDPGNRALHADLNHQPEFQAKTDLDPDSSNSANASDFSLAGDHPERDADLKRSSSLTGAPGSTHPQDWIDSAEIFAELHRRIGRPIIADYYTRIYPRSLFHFKGARRLDVLNETADALVSEWRDDGGFLRFRRNNYYSEREMDVPNRLLKRWRAARERQGCLSIDDLSELAALPDPVLNHADLQQAVMMKYGLDEWPMVPNARKELLVYANLTPEQREQCRSAAGLPLAELSEDDRERCLKAFGTSDLAPDELAQARFMLYLRAPRRYEWSSLLRGKATQIFPFPLEVSEKDKETAAAKVREILRARGDTREAVDFSADELKGPHAGLMSLLGYDRNYDWRESDGWFGSSANSGSLRDSPDGASSPQAGSPPSPGGAPVSD